MTGVGNVIRLLKNGAVRSNYWLDFEIKANVVLDNGKNQNSGMYWRFGYTLAFSGDTFTVADNSYSTIYAGNNESDFSLGNSKIVFNTQMIVYDYITQTQGAYISDSAHGYSSEVTMIGNTSNKIAQYTVEKQVILNLGKTEGAYAFDVSPDITGFQLTVTGSSIVNIMEDGQFSRNATIRFSAPYNGSAGVINLNGYKVHVGTFAISDAAQVSDGIDVTISLGGGGVFQFDSFEADTGTFLGGVSHIIIKDFDSDSMFISGTKLSEYFVDAATNGIDLIYFDGFGMKGEDYLVYEHETVIDGETFWYYDMSVVPEPSTCTIIFGVGALLFVFYRKIY